MDGGATVRTFEGPGLVLCQGGQGGGNIGRPILGSPQGIQIQHPADGLHVPSLCIPDGTIQGRVKGEGFLLGGKLALEGSDLALKVCHIHALEGLEAVLGGLKLGSQGVHLALKLGGLSLFRVHICAVLGHEPRQLFLCDAGDLLFDFVSLHGFSFLRYALVTGVASPVRLAVLRRAKAKWYEKSTVRVAQCSSQQKIQLFGLPLGDFNFGNNVFQCFPVKIRSGKYLINAMNLHRVSVKVQVKKIWIIWVNTAVKSIIFKAKNIAKL
jgi:hypothetical protein